MRSIIVTGLALALAGCGANHSSGDYTLSHVDAAQQHLHDAVANLAEGYPSCSLMNVGGGAIALSCPQGQDGADALGEVVDLTIHIAEKEGCKPVTLVYDEWIGGTQSAMANLNC